MIISKILKVGELTSRELAKKIDRYCYRNNLYDYRFFFHNRNFFMRELEKDLEMTGRGNGSEGIKDVIDWLAEALVSEIDKSEEARELLMDIYEYRRGRK